MKDLKRVIATLGKLTGKVHSQVMLALQSKGCERTRQIQR